MIGKTSSKNSRNKNIQIQKQKLKQESYLSGAYIRSLVKQLSSQRSRATMSPKLQGEKVGNESAKFGKVIPETQQQQISSQRPQSQLQPKKQVRRRLHSRKPYQQRLLNMAEARREIVAALKFHRASMKQVSERQQQQEQHKQLSSLLEFPPYSLSTNRENSFLDMNPWRNLANQIAPVSSPYGYMSTTTSAPTSHLSNPSWSLSSISPFETSGNLGIIPPVLPLGLNLNLQSFKDIETAVTFTEADASPLMDLSCVTTTASSAPSPSTSSAYSFSSGALSASEVPSVWLGTVGASEVTSEPTIDSLYHFVAEPEVEGLQNIGNQHNMDWNDTLNSVQSDWWHELLETVENGSVVREERVVDGNGDGIHLETIDYPSWPSDQQLMHNFYQGVEHPGDLAFPCLDIGEVEGLGGEWIL